jgi:hypothetical protein
MGEYASRAREWGSEPISWVPREIEFLKAWEEERLTDRLFKKSAVLDLHMSSYCAPPPKQGQP